MLLDYLCKDLPYEKLDTIITDYDSSVIAKKIELRVYLDLLLKREK